MLDNARTVTGGRAPELNALRSVPGASYFRPARAETMRAVRRGNGFCLERVRQANRSAVAQRPSAGLAMNSNG